MRDFASGAFRLRHAPRPLRLIYAGFLVLAGAGLLTQAGFQAGRVGLTPARIAMYYRGGETEAEISLPKPFGHLVEVTHAHAFTMGLTFLVLAHLFVATGARPSTKAALVLAAFAGLLGDLVAPWLVRYVAGDFAWLQLAAWLAIWASSGPMVIVSLWECLAPAPPRGRRAEGRAIG